MKEKDLEIANAQRLYHITYADVPLSCPMPNMRLWDSHPRVYLPIAETGHEICPYCGAEYILKGFDKALYKEKKDID